MFRRRLTERSGIDVLWFAWEALVADRRRTSTVNALTGDHTITVGVSSFDESVVGIYHLQRAFFELGRTILSFK